MVEAEMFLLERAYTEEYDYYHIISGADIPLRSNEEINRFFEENHGKEFIQFNEFQLENDPEIKRRTRLYHFLQNYRRKYKYQLINNCFVFLERVSLALQLLLGINRIRNLDWTIKYGSQWASITHELVGSILDQREKIGEVFSYTNCSDELFVHTVAFNCGFQDRIYQPLSDETANMRLIDWSRGKNGSPYTFRMNDLEMLTTSKALFARKFSENIDRNIIVSLYKRLEN